MYQSMLYYLISLEAIAFVLSIFSVLPYNPFDILSEAVYLAVISYLSNKLFARIFKTRENPESQFITALIISLLMGPMPVISNIVVLTLLPVFANASKYVLVIKKRHVFNPAALAVVLSAVIFRTGASWWIGSKYLVVFVIVMGLYTAYRIKRFHLILSFLAIFALLTVAFSALKGFSGGQSLEQLVNILIYSPILFFSFVMLVEPLTSPAQRRIRIYYGVFIGAVLVLLQNFTTGIFYTLELSLLAGNVFGRAFNLNPLLVLSFKERKDWTKNISSFIFKSQRKFNFKAGQFLEWTLSHKNADNRGIRRYFTISSSPTEDAIILTTKFAEKSSTFKKKLLEIKVRDEITATGPDGEFTVDENSSHSLVFIAGGIGITPFRSIIKYLTDKKIKKDIVLLYSAKTREEFIFGDIFDEAEKSFGLKTVYIITGGQEEESQVNLENIPVMRKFRAGTINFEIIKEEVLDWQNRIYYISGPEPMVESLEKTVGAMGIESKNIKRDYFPGYSE